ncbi:hypothetical protein FRZ44_37550 [Hypericibacter terrae]|uniref:Uncharacterized protein n=1 Tax=Hypericibacter terrae TaxID=2602015 RepID=A0A5J6MLL8_9PROT|nr:hypothetical protein FRZ44_37550 [Hypericibacter terrae]
MVDPDARSGPCKPMQGGVFRLSLWPNPLTESPLCRRRLRRWLKDRAFRARGAIRPRFLPARPALPHKTMTATAGHRSGGARPFLCRSVRIEPVTIPSALAPPGGTGHIAGA